MRHANRHPLLAHPGACAIAHRGGALEAEENTLPAFRHAAALGYTHVELDVHATRDGVVVIHHDPDLQRLCGVPSRIAALDWPALRDIRTLQGAGIARLQDLLEEMPSLNVVIEAKSDDVIAPLAQLITRMGALDRICIGAFNPARTAQAREALGQGLLWSPAHMQVARLWARGWGLPFGLQDFAVVQVPRRWRGIDLVTPRFVQAAHACGIAVQVWTVNTAPDMTRLLDMGVDGIITDRPSLLRDVLHARGAWAGPAPLLP